MAAGAPAPQDRSQISAVRREEQDVSVSANGEERVLITAQGYEQLGRDLDRLRNEERQRLVRLLREARADGNLSDNPALVDLLDEQAQLERRVATLEAQLAGAQVAPPPRDGHAAVGSVVRVRDLGRDAVVDYELVGPLEGDPINGRVSIAAPIGRALVGTRRGAEVEVATPRGIVALEVTDVRPAQHALVDQAA
jgi:transcription elongation factor GreA